MLALQTTGWRRARNTLLQQSETRMPKSPIRLSALRVGNHLSLLQVNPSDNTLTPIRQSLPRNACQLDSEACRKHTHQREHTHTHRRRLDRRPQSSSRGDRFGAQGSGCNRLQHIGALEKRLPRDRNIPHAPRKPGSSPKAVTPDSRWPSSPGNQDLWSDQLQRAI